MEIAPDILTTNFDAKYWVNVHFSEAHFFSIKIHDHSFEHDKVYNLFDQEKSYGQIYHEEE